MKSFNLLSFNLFFSVSFLRFRFVPMRSLPVKLILAVLIACPLHVPAHAEVLLTVPPIAHAAQPEEEFAESQFGMPPTRSDSPIRKPAGLEFTDQTGQVKSTPVIPVESPLSMANRNPEPGAGSRAGIQEVALIAGDLGFFPKTLFVTKGIPVRMYVTGASTKSLCIMMDFFEVRRQVRAKKIEEVIFTPTQAGQFRFYCPINGMEGTILVKEMDFNATEAKQQGMALGTGVGMVGNR